MATLQQHREWSSGACHHPGAEVESGGGQSCDVVEAKTTTSPAPTESPSPRKSNARWTVDGAHV
eukprot:955268-Amphidinium_carterae.1